MLTDMFKKIKGWEEEYQNEICIALAIILVGAAGFGLGRLSKIVKGKGPLEAKLPSLYSEANPPSLPSTGDLDAPHPSTGKTLVGSKNGAKYHFPWCPGALRISEKNKVWFASKEAAEAAGYTKAGNCAGL